MRGRSCFFVVLAANVVMFLFGGGRVEAASFDCHEGISPIEQMICRDPTLNSLDSEVEGAYLGALERSNNPARVKQTERVWLTQRDACADTKCIAAAYLRQIKLLSSISDEPPVCGGASTLEVNSCAAEYSRRANLELARYIAAARKRLMDEIKDEPDDKSSQKALTQFEASQAAWENYRKIECNAVYDWWSAGTIRGAMYEGCWLSVTKSRSLSIWQTWLQFMDSTPPLLPKPTEK